MERDPNKLHCVTCGKGKATFKCLGCLQDFCFNHLKEHRDYLSLQLDDIQINRDLFQQTFNEQSTNPEYNGLIKEINQWENNAIKTIQTTAEKCRNRLLSKHLTKHMNRIELNLSTLTDRIKEIRKENDFNEIDLDEIQQKLTKLTQILDKPSHISIQHDSTSFINKISVVVSSQNLVSSYINSNTKWKQEGITVVGGNGKGNKLNQLSNPFGIQVDDDNECIYIADKDNHCIIKWNYDEKVEESAKSEYYYGSESHLCYPTDMIIDKKTDSLIICDQGNRRVIRLSLQNKTSYQTLISCIYCYGLSIDKNGDLYVSDFERNEVRRWKIGDNNGTLVAGGNGKGSKLNQLNYPTFIFVDNDCSVYVSDRDNHRVMKWIKGAKEGIMVAGRQGKGNNLSQLSFPQGVTVDDEGNIYVSDSENHRIMRWSPGSTEGIIVLGGNGKGQESNQLNLSSSLSVDEDGNLYIVDNGNYRVQKFSCN